MHCYINDLLCLSIILEPFRKYLEEYIRKGEKTSDGENMLVYSIAKPELVKFNLIDEKN